MELKEDTKLYEGDTYEVRVQSKTVDNEVIDPEDVDSVAIYHERPDGTEESREDDECTVVDGMFAAVFTLSDEGEHLFSYTVTSDGAQKSGKLRKVKVLAFHD